MFLKQSTATTLLLGPFVDSADATVETGLTLSQADILLWKEGGTTLAQKNESTSCTHRSNGMYTCPINTTDTNTLGTLEVSVAESGTMVYTKRYLVVPANVYDSLVLGTDLIDSSVVQWTGTSVATPDTAGYPKVTIKSGSGTGEVSLSSGGVSLSASGLAAAADAVLDEPMSGHVAAGSLGATLFLIRSGTAQAGSGTTITLDASASAVDDFYNNQKIHIVSGTGVGQGRIISDYVGSTKVATVASWATNPDNTSVFVILPFGSIPGATAPTAGEVADAVLDEALSGHTTSGSLGQLLGGLSHRTATAQAGSSSSITLDASASATDDRYNYNYISIFSGTGAGQTRQITDYVGSTKVATVNINWTVNPSSDSVFFILPGGLDAATVAAIASGVWAATRAGNATAGSFGEYVNADAIRLSGDSTAADNAESFFDGTGYAGTNNVIPSVTTVTGNVNGNVGGSVASVTALAANSVNASALAADAVAEIQSGLATAANLATVDTVVDAIQAKTDDLTFTVAGEVDVNIKSINDAALDGDGTSGTPWGPA